MLRESKYQIGQSLYRKGKYKESMEVFEANILDSSTGEEQVFLSKFGIALCYLKLKDLETSYRQLLITKEYLEEKYVERKNEYICTPRYALREDVEKDCEENDCRYINNNNVYNLFYNIEYLKLRINGNNFINISVMYTNVKALSEKFRITEPDLENLVAIANEHRKKKIK